MPGARSHANPFQFALQGLDALAFTLFLGRQPRLLLFQPGRIVAFIRHADSAVQLEDPAGDIIEKITVVGDCDHRAGVLLQVFFQPGHGFSIKMVGGLIQQQNVGLLQQQTAQCHATALATRKNFDRGLGWRAAQRIHCHFQARIDVPGVQVIDFFLHLALFLDQRGHFVVAHRLSEAVADGIEFCQQPDGLLRAFFDNFTHGFGVVQPRFLFQQPD